MIRFALFLLALIAVASPAEAGHLKVGDTFTLNKFCESLEDTQGILTGDGGDYQCFETTGPLPCMFMAYHGDLVPVSGQLVRILSCAPIGVQADGPIFSLEVLRGGAA